MNDLISRQAAIDTLEAKKDKSAKGDIGCFYNTIIQNNIDALKAVPSAEPRWIPVTERLPEVVERFTNAENVLAHDDGTFEFFGVFTEYESAPVLVEGIAEGEHGIFTAIYSMWKYEDGAVETAWFDNIISDIEIKNVTAWMYLPKPWKGEADVRHKEKGD